jgi:hypothetical protein
MAQSAAHYAGNISKQVYAQRLRSLLERMRDRWMGSGRETEFHYTAFFGSLNKYLMQQGIVRGGSGRGGGKLNNSLAEKYLLGTLQTRIKPYTELRLGFCVGWLFPEDETWGGNISDRWQRCQVALDRFRDEIAYGGPAPMTDPKSYAARWASEPSAVERIAVVQIEAQLPSMELEDLLELQQKVGIEIYRRADDCRKSMTATIEEPCDPDCPIARWVAATLREKPLTAPTVARLAEDAEIPLPRLKRLLCGDPATAEEMAAIAMGCGVAVDNLQIFLEAMAPLQANLHDPA